VLMREMPLSKHRWRPEGCPASATIYYLSSRRRVCEPQVIEIDQAVAERTGIDAAHYWPGNGAAFELCRQHTLPHHGGWFFHAMFGAKDVPMTHLRRAKLGDLARVATALPNKLQCKLNLSRGSRCRSERTGAKNRRQIRIEQTNVRGVGRTEVCMVQDIKELGSELHVEIFREPMYAIVLVKRLVQV
jgi:hypothetical protein